MLARVVEGLRIFRPPDWGPRLDSDYAECRGISVRPSSNSELFFLRPLFEPMGLNWFSTATFFIYRSIRPNLSGIFALDQRGLKVNNIRGVGVLLWGEFNGEVENLAPNFSPPNYTRAAVRGGLDARARALPNFISTATWAF